MFSIVCYDSNVSCHNILLVARNLRFLLHLRYFIVP